MAWAERKRPVGKGRPPPVVEKGRFAAGKENLVGGMATLAVKCTVVEGRKAEDRTPAGVGVVVAHS